MRISCEILWVVLATIHITSIEIAKHTKSVLCNSTKIRNRCRRWRYRLLVISEVALSVASCHVIIQHSVSNPFLCVMCILSMTFLPSRKSASINPITYTRPSVYSTASFNFLNRFARTPSLPALFHRPWSKTPFLRRPILWTASPHLLTSIDGVLNSPTGLRRSWRSVFSPRSKLITVKIYTIIHVYLVSVFHFLKQMFKFFVTCSLETFYHEKVSKLVEPELSIVQNY